MDWVLHDPPDDDDNEDVDAESVHSHAFNVGSQSFYSLHSLLAYVFKNNIRVTDEYIYRRWSMMPLALPRTSPHPSTTTTTRRR